MLKGQVVAGDFSKIVMRVKSDQEVELGELVVIEEGQEKFILQVYDLIYGSQISLQNLEMVSGMSLEEGNFNIMDEQLRNYQLALLKPILNVGSQSKTCKKLPPFFTKIREITKEDLAFITTPNNPLFLGKLRSGSKEMDFNVFLSGEDVLSHHVLIPASTGKGKSLDGEELVMIKCQENIKLLPIQQLVDGLFELNKNQLIRDGETIFLQNLDDYKAFSFNPQTNICEWKPIQKFIRHNAPIYMYLVETKSGRSVTVTGDHSLYALRDGQLKLLETASLQTTDYLPLPLEMENSQSLDYLNLLEFMKGKNTYVFLPPKLTTSIGLQRILKLLKNSRPSQKLYEIKKTNKLSLSIVTQLLSLSEIEQNLHLMRVVGYNDQNSFPAKFPLSQEFLRLMGYYLAEGHINNNSVRITNSNPKVLKDLVIILQKMKLRFFYTYFTFQKDRKSGIAISSALLVDFLLAMGFGNGAGNKEFPNFVFGLSNEQISEIIKAYFEGDGSIYRQGKKNSYEISAVSKSRKLVDQLSYLLLRFGIFSRITCKYKRATNSNHTGGDYYELILSGKQNVQTYLQKIGFVTKGKNILFNYIENTNTDLIPFNLNLVSTIRRKLNITRSELAGLCQCSESMIAAVEIGKRRLSRNLATIMFNVLEERAKNMELLVRELEEGKILLRLRWDQIKSVSKIDYKKNYVYDLSVQDNETFLAGHGGIFVHNSNLMSCILWDILSHNYAGVLVLDPHDEYYGRVGLGLKDHPRQNRVSYYTPAASLPGARTLKINLKKLKPEHFQGAISLSDPQQQCLYAYYRKFREDWILSIFEEKRIENVNFHEDTISVVKRKLISLLGLEFENNQLYCRGIFDEVAGENTVAEICQELENGKIVIIDTSFFSGAIEILVGSLITTEIFEKYKYYKKSGQLQNKPVISVVLEEAPRVLGKKVLEQGSNIFETLAREGRKFKVGLIAITQLPSEIPKNILANMNTKIILGLEMNSERQAVMESAPQDLSQDNRNIAALDKGEALVTSTFTKFAVPVKVPLFKEFAKKGEKTNQHYIGFS